MNGIEGTPDRKRAFLLSRPYYVYTLQLVCRKDETRIDRLSDCKKGGFEVGTMRNTAAWRLLNQKGYKVRPYDDQTTPYKDLSQNQIDAVLLDLPIALQYTKRDRDFQSKLKFVGKPLAPGFYVIAFRKTDEQLAAKFDRAIEKLLDSGKLKQIYEHWELWNDDQAALRTLQLPPPAADDPGEDNTLRETPSDWTFRNYFPLLWQGALMTVALTLAGFSLAVCLGLPIAAARLYGPAPLRWLAAIYVEFFRGIPVYLLLFFLYYSLPEIGNLLHLPFPMKLHPFAAGVLGFGLNYAAYRVRDLSCRHILDPRRPMGGGRVVGDVSAADFLPHHSSPSHQGDLAADDRTISSPCSRIRASSA